jgi:hypothetical protein
LESADVCSILVSSSEILSVSIRDRYCCRRNVEAFELAEKLARRVVDEMCFDSRRERSRHGSDAMYAITLDLELPGSQEKRFGAGRCERFL